MKHFLRPYYSIGFVALMGAWVAMAPPGAPAQAAGMMQLLQEPSPMLLYSSSSQGYLGVDVSDVDQDKAQALKLKEVRGAVITLIDHDAPAGQIGLKVNDVVIQLNGQNVEGAEQLRRMLREIPAGRKVSIEISRDGNIQTLAVELADRKVLGHDVWNKIGNGGDVFAQGSGLGILMGEGDGALPGGFHMPFGSTLNVGALVEPLTSQMAEYLGVSSGLMVKQVARKSEAAAAGLKVFDVILKVGADSVTTLSDWDRALRSNQGKPVQVTILRDKKQQTLTLQVDSKHTQGKLGFEQVFPSGDGPLVAEIDPEFAQQLAGEAAATAETLALSDQAQALRDQLQAGEAERFALNSEQVEALRKQAEALSQSLKDEDLKIDQKQLDQLKQQMEEFRKSFKPEDFKLDPKQFDQLNRQMEELRQELKPEKLQIAPD
ncbi:MAG TPA: PDZ domain-containing protein [Terracidiphilus sp.]|nr:PDZ domain-containing protein [Terracidiphilus sp.]